MVRKCSFVVVSIHFVPEAGTYEVGFYISVIGCVYILGVLLGVQETYTLLHISIDK